MSSRSRARWIGCVAAAILAAACNRADGPSPIAFDEEVCAHCRMLISDPAFAAQLELEDGSVASFDDPGCLLAALPDHRPRALWFHHVREERWIPAERVAFERVPRSPMGYGLGAVDAAAEGGAAGRATAGALSLEAAKALVAERGAAR